MCIYINYKYKILFSKYIWNCQFTLNFVLISWNKKCEPKSDFSALTAYCTHPVKNVYRFFNF